MGWESRHLHEFRVLGKKYSDPSYDEFGSDADFPVLDETSVTLVDISVQTREIEYIYDFGDGWRHRIEIEDVCEPDPRITLPICIGGANACPPEDCGGLGGYADFLEKLKLQAAFDPENPHDPDVLEWIGGYFDPSAFDPNRINIEHLWKKKR